MTQRSSDIGREAPTPHPGWLPVGLDINRAPPELLRTLINMLPALVWISDAAVNITYVNRATLEFTGQQDAEAVGRGWLNTLHPDDRARNQADLERAISTRSAFTTTFRLRRHDGVYFWVSARGEPFLDEHGELGGFIGVISDIDDLRASMEAERAQRERFQLAATGTTDGLWDRADLGGEAVWFSPRMLELIGYTEDEVEHTVAGFLRLMHADDIDRVRQTIRHAVKNANSFEVDFRLRGRDDAYRWFRARAGLARNETGRCVRMTGSLQDIDEHRKLEIQARRDHLRSALAENVARVGSWMWDPRTGELSWSDELFRLLGLDPATTEADFETAYAVMHADDRAEMRAWIEELSTISSGTFAKEFRVVSADGEVRVLHDFGRCTSDPETGGRIMVGILRDVTEDRARESALETARRAYANAEELANIGSWELDLPNGQLFWSEQARRMVGVDAEDVNLDTFTAAIHPEDHERVTRTLDEYIRGVNNDYDGIEHRLIRKDGRVLTLVERVSAKRDAEGRALLINGSAIDVTAARAAEREVRRFKTTLDATQDGVFLYEADTLQFFYVNAGACAYTGYSEAELVSMKAYDLNPGLDAESVWDAFAGLVSGEVDSVTRTGFHRHRDGRLIPVEVVTQYVARPNDLPTFVSIARDVSARLASEARIRELKLSLDRVSDGVFLYDPDTLLFSYVNQGACNYLGYSETELLSMKPHEVSASYDEARIRQMVADLRRDESVRHVAEVMHQRKDGTLVPVEIAVQYLHPIGEAPRVVTISRDITERLSARRAQERHQQELEGMVEARTRELAEAQAELIKQERLSTLGQLSASVSHELRNPLATIGSSLYVLKSLMPDDGSRQVGIIERIERNVARCDNIIGEMLDFTRHRNVSLETLDANLTIRNQLADYQMPAGIGFEFSPGEFAAAADLDPDALRRALVNLLDNAAHAVSERQEDAPADYAPRIRLLTRMRDQDYLEIVVEDNGCGMNSEVRERIFEPLFSTKSFGVGLGMIIVRNIIEMHHGTIALQSEPGAGTTFTLALPLAGHA